MTCSSGRVRVRLWREERRKEMNKAGERMREKGRRKRGRVENPG